MKRQDFLFTIGYQGDTALVDGGARKTYGNASVDELLKEGLYRPAFCAALYDDEQEAFGRIIAEMNSHESRSYESVEDLSRLFGVFTVPEGVKKVTVI